MTVGQQSAMDELLPRYGLDPEQPLDPVQTFGRNAPLVFEIGFGVGDYLLARATAQPQTDFIGVEVHRPGVGHLLSRVHAAGLGNVRVYSTDAIEVLDRCIADASLDELVIQFPDPWHKKRHNKRRLVQPSFARRAVRVLKPAGACVWPPTGPTTRCRWSRCSTPSRACTTSATRPITCPNLRSERSPASRSAASAWGIRCSIWPISARLTHTRHRRDVG